MGRLLRFMMKVSKTQLSKTVAYFKKTPMTVERATRMAVRREAEAVRRASMEQVPVVTGRLKNSSRVYLRGNTAILSYDAPYAVMVHEIPRPAGSNGKWKYLEDPLKEALPGYSERIADAVRAILEGGSSRFGRDVAGARRSAGRASKKAKRAAKKAKRTAKRFTRSAKKAKRTIKKAIRRASKRFR